MGRNRMLDNVDGHLADIEAAYEGTVAALRLVIGATAH